MSNFVIGNAVRCERVDYGYSAWEYELFDYEPYDEDYDYEDDEDE